jgi:tetratricopeptide (TPR) repeat protein
LPVSLAALLERTLHGVKRAQDDATPAMLFRRADRCRNEGRYDEALGLVSMGLRLAPHSSAGRLISGYVHMAGRRMDRARSEFQRVLAVDPHHPRALLGLARIQIEDQDLGGAKTLLDRALLYYPDFPEAQALRDMLEGWPPVQAEAPAVPAIAFRGQVSASGRERDVIVLRTDGSLLLTGTDEERGRQLAQHAMQVYRTASATLARAGLGALRSAAIDTGSHMSFLLKDADILFSATMDGTVEVAAGLAQAARLRSDLGVKA